MLKAVAFLCIAVSLIAGPSLAQIDPDSNSSGIYFDEGAMVYCSDTTVGGQVTAYYCLTRLTSPSGISFWEATLELSPSGSVLAWNLRGQAVNASAPPEFVVSLAEPLPWQSSLVVLEMTVSVDDVHPIGLRAGPATSPSLPHAPFPLPVYAAGDDPQDFHTVGYSFGWDPISGVPNWCAIINPIGGCPADPLPTESPTWGGIKVLYR